LSQAPKQKSPAQSNPLFELGKERLELIGKHADALMQGYLEGQVNELAFSQQALQKLLDSRILFYPEEQSLSLRPIVNELIASLTRDERKRQINTDVGEHLDQIDTRVQSLQAARKKGDYAASEHHMQLLTERVNDMTGQFGDAIESLWHRLNTEFGFVSSLDDKILEIELAQRQLRRILDGFGIINFDDLIQLAGSDGALRKLLVSQLQARISEHSGSLLEVQKRLVLLMARFRQQQDRALLINRMAAFLRQHPNFQIGDYPNRSQVPAVINQAHGISAQAFIALDRAQDSYTLAELARAVPREPEQASQSDKQTEGFVMAVQNLVATQQKQLAKDVEDFFIRVIESPEALSGVDYLAEQALPWEPEMWLFQIVAEYQGLPEQNKHSFMLEKDSAQKSRFNQLHIIQDVTVGMRFFGDFQAAG
jgi:TorA maturation chaperone TorD